MVEEKGMTVDMGAYEEARKQAQVSHPVSGGQVHVYTDTALTLHFSK